MFAINQRKPISAVLLSRLCTILSVHCKRRVFLILLFLFVSIPALTTKIAHAESRYYYHYFDKKQPLVLYPNRVVFRQIPVEVKGIESASLARFGIADEYIEPWTVAGWYVAKTTFLRTEKDVQVLLSQIAGNADIDFVSPVFIDETWGGEIVITQDILVGLKDNVTSNQAEALLSKLFKGIVLARNWGNMPGVYRLRSVSRNGFEVLRAANLLAEQPEVKFAEPVVFFTGWTSLTPNDPGFSNCWGIHNTGQSGGTVDIDMDGPEAWEITTGDPSIKVVIIDEGVQQNHPDIHQMAGTDTTTDGPGDGGPVNGFDNHGTAVAGCVAATINNGLGTVGIAPDCLVASARAHIGIDNRHFITDTTWVVNALSWAESIGARVTNNSNSYGFTSSVIATKYQQTRANGMVHFASAGNDSSGTIAYPGNLPTVNALAAIDRNGQLASFSNWGAGLDFSGPGVSIYTTDRTGSAGYSSVDYAFVDGTSFASPYAAGVASLVLSLNPSLSTDEVEQLMKDSCIDLGPVGYDTNFGWGLVNMYGIITAAEGHDVEAGLYVSQAGVIHPPESPVSGEVWATNIGTYTEFGNLKVYLEKPNGESLCSPLTFRFTNLGIGETTSHYPFSLTPNYAYEGAALVRTTVSGVLDENPANNNKTVPVSFSGNLNPTDSFDGFKCNEITSGETIIVTDRNGQQHTVKHGGIGDPQGNCITLIIDGEWFNPCLGDYILGLPWAVIQLGYKVVGTYRYGLYFWFPDNIYTFSTQYVTIPWGGTATFEISRTSGSWYNVEDYTVEFLSGLLPSDWSSSVTTQDYRLVVKVQAAHGSGTINFDGWAHLHTKNRVVTIYTDAFKWMRFQTVSSAPETVIISGPEGLIKTNDVTFVWSGSDDTTPVGQLQYAYRLDPIEPVFSPFSIDTQKTYNNLQDREYTFYVKARDLGGIEDPPPYASRSFIVSTNCEPNRPVNQYPEPNQVGISVTPTLVGSPFFDPDQGNTFDKSKFQMRSDNGTYVHPVWDSRSLTPGTITVQIPSGLLFSGTKYWWRCCYSDNKGAWSQWSLETSFTTEGFLNFRDFAIVGNYWMCSEPDSCGSSDLDDSGTVDFKDIRLFAQRWLGQYTCTYEVRNLTKLTDGPIQESGPAFNINGTKIAYRNFHEPYSWNTCDIWVMNTDGSGKTQITTDLKGEFEPSFLANGRISYVKEFGSNDYNIWLVNPDGSNPCELIGGPLRQGGAGHDWHPSELKLIYTNEYIQDAAEIWVADAQGCGQVSNKQKLTDHTVDGYCQYSPVYSRSGNKIAYGNHATQGAQPHVWVMNSNESGKFQITFGSGETPVFWWHGDSSVGYIRNGEIWLHNLATGIDDLLLAVPSASISRSDLSHDCTKLVFDLSDASGTHVWIGEVVCNSSP